MVFDENDPFKYTSTQYLKAHSFTSVYIHENYNVNLRGRAYLQDINKFIKYNIISHTSS